MQMLASYRFPFCCKDQIDNDMIMADFCMTEIYEKLSQMNAVSNIRARTRLPSLLFLKRRHAGLVEGH